MRKIKAIVYGVGTLNKLITKYMVEKGIDIVGAIDVNQDLIGKDLGEVAGLNRKLNVVITDDADTVLTEAEADIASVAIFSQMERMYPIFKNCIANGLNIITTGEQALYPWEICPEPASKLDKLAKKYGVTITAGGNLDNTRVNMFILLTGACHKITSITLRQQSDLRRSLPGVLHRYGIGGTREDYFTYLKEKGEEPTSIRLAVEAIMADLGLTVKKIEESAEPAILDEDMELEDPGQFLRKGQNAGHTKIVEFDTEQGIKVRGEQFFKIFKKGEGGSSVECFIEGVPSIHLVIDKFDIRASCCAQIVNRIPDVINSEPGFITVEKLDKLKFRAFPLEYYLT
jgi:hypothetical protein